MYFTNETGSCKATVQFLQKVHGLDITHDNVFSMLCCFNSYVAATINRASYFKLKCCLLQNHLSCPVMVDTSFLFF